jgi:hypothetical protein
MHLMIQHFAVWLAATPVSLFIQNVLWIIPAVQCVHIVMIAIVLSSVAMIDLRIFGMAGREASLRQTADRYLPWIWWALIVLAITGMTLITGEPVRSLTNPAFQIKMLLLLAAVIVTVVFQVTVHRDAALWDQSRLSAPAIKIAAVATLLLWFAIAVAGRWIAYMVLDYGA